MAIDLGTLVTLLVDKEHPDRNGEGLSAGVSGLVVQANNNADGSVRYVVDYGAEGQWNCEENELSQEGRAAPPVPERSRRYDGDWALYPLGALDEEPSVAGPKPKASEQEDGKVLSFEEEMALLGEE